MSNYIHVLKRLEKERREHGAPPPSATQASIAIAPAATPADGDVSPQLAAAATVVSAPVQLSVTPVGTAVPTKPAAAPSHPAVMLRAMPSAARTSDHATASTSRSDTRADAMDTRRAESDGATGRGATERPSVRRESPAAPTPDRRRALSAETLKGIATLLDNIRVLAAGKTTRTVVFAGASSSEHVDLVTAGLADHAQQRGLVAFTATLTKVDGRSYVTPLHAAGAERDGVRALEVDLDGGAAPTVLSAWIERIAPDAQLVIIAGPPLAESIDTALLACASDGLVIVAESEVTDRNALQLAAERARIAGCRTLGVVMHGTQDRLPAWMRRLMRSSHAAPRED